eukprot:scaffold2610_cov301-Prasinococcus_capsulatus_cf.AAC.8
MSFSAANSGEGSTCCCRMQAALGLTATNRGPPRARFSAAQRTCRQRVHEEESSSASPVYDGPKFSASPAAGACRMCSSVMVESRRILHDLP